MIIARPLHPNEPDLLAGNEHQPLIVKNLDEKEVRRIDAPENGWSLEQLEQTDYQQISPEWDAYLGNQWIGSSEV